MSADSVPSSKTNIFQNKLIYCRHFRGAQCLIEVMRSFGEEMWRVDAYQILYYSRGIEGEKRTHPRFADWRQDKKKTERGRNWHDSNQP
jgi:hypothetical protein